MIASISDLVRVPLLEISGGIGTLVGSASRTLARSLAAAVSRLIRAIDARTTGSAVGEIHLMQGVFLPLFSTQYLIPYQYESCSPGSAFRRFSSTSQSYGNVTSSPMRNPVNIRIATPEMKMSTQFLTSPSGAVVRRW